MDVLSYRQTGKASKGVLMRGAPRRGTRARRGGRESSPLFSTPMRARPSSRGPAAGKLTGQSQNAGKNFSTIPSKFETTLFTGNKEKDGFGSRAHRFVDVENDLPGPGTYAYAEQKIKDDMVYSKKGLGVGFVSKTKRESQFKAGASAPGPGNYERGASFMDDIREKNRANRSGSTSTFKPPTERSVMVAADPMPGPADYRLNRELDADAPRPLPQRLEDSVFRSRTYRGQGPGKGAAGGAVRTAGAARPRRRRRAAHRRLPLRRARGRPRARRAPHP